MRYFSKTENENLYNSNLPDKLKNYIANFNEIIICYLKEKFQDKDNFNIFLNTIMESYKKVKYEISDEINATACFSYNKATDELTFKINTNTLDMYSIEEGLIGIYFHEFSHFISYVLKVDTRIRIEEAIADLFSDELIDYFNNTFANEHLLDYKKSIYETPGSIVRSACIISNNPSELLWEYYNKNIKNFFEKVYKKELTELILNIEEYTNSYNYINEEEQKGIKQTLETINPLTIPEKFIRLNTIAQEELYKKLQELNLTETQIKEKFPNIPTEFFEKYSILFSDLNTQKQNIINSEITEKNIEQIAQSFLKHIDIDNYENTKQKLGIYNDYVIDAMLNIIKYTKIYTFDAQQLIATFYAYDLIYNEKDYENESLYEKLKTMGFDNYIEKSTYNQINEQAKRIYNKLKNVEKQNRFQIIKELLKKQIKDSITLDYLEKQLKDKKITLDNYIELMIESYKKSNEKNVYTPKIYLISLIQKYVKEISKNKKINITTFEETKTSLTEYIGKLNSEIDINSIILRNWDKKNISIYDIVEILSINKIGTTTSSENFEDIRIIGLIEAKEEQNLSNIFRYIKAINSENYCESLPFYYHKKNSFVYDKTRATKEIENTFFQILENESRKKNPLLLEQVKDNYLDLLYFYRYKSLDQISEQDIKIIKGIKKFENIDEQERNFDKVFGHYFDKEIYNSINEYPHLAATYLGRYLPYYTSITTSTLYFMHNDITKYDNEILHNEYLKAFLKIANEIINNNYNIPEYELKYEGLEHEQEILKRAPYNILNESDEEKLILALIEICNIKIKKIFIEKVETFEKKEDLLQETIKKIEELHESTTVNIIKTKTEELLNILKNITLEIEKTK